MLELREHLGLTQVQIAEFFARGWKQVSAWERGAQRPPPVVLTRAAKNQGWPIEIFMKGGPRPADTVPLPQSLSPAAAVVQVVAVSPTLSQSGAVEGILEATGFDPEEADPQQVLRVVDFWFAERLSEAGDRAKGQHWLRILFQAGRRAGRAEERGKGKAG